MRVLVAALVIFPVLSAAAPPTATLLPFSMPSRTAQGELAQRRLQQVAQRLEELWHLDPQPRPPALADLGPRLARAQALALEGDVDQAASNYDAALEDGARALHRVPNPSAFIDALVSRAAIALARGERERAATLLLRARRYDPFFELLPRERSPALRALWQTLAREDQALAIDDVAEPCQAAQVVIVARSQGSAVELSRYDGCKRSRTVVTSDVEEAARALSSPMPHLPDPPRVAVHARADRRRLIAGGATLAGGLAALVVGTVFAARAASEYASLDEGCTTASPCGIERLTVRGEEYRRDTAIAIGLSSVAGIGLVVGAVLVFYGTRRAQARPPGASVAPGASGLLVRF